MNDIFFVGDITEEPVVDQSGKVVDGENISETIQIVIEEECHKSADSEVNVNEEDLLITCQILNQEKHNLENELKTAYETIKHYRTELYTYEEKTGAVLEDNQFLRTENVKLKNKMKQMKENDNFRMPEDWEISSSLSSKPDMVDGQ